ncbi:MAG: HAMP domain-containing protein, partial [Chloroflexi bacterium]|nr:HAMP domain-containing protein [Chloroflexota bacterium]
MSTLRVRLVLAMLATSLIVAGVILIAVRWYSTEQITFLLMEGVDSEAEARAMADEFVARVAVIGAVAGLILGGVSAWWLSRRVLRPLARLTEATHLVAAGNLAARIPLPSDRELRDVAHSFNQMAATLERVEQLRTALVEDVAHELRTPLTSLRGYTEALADGVVEPSTEMLRTVHEEIERLTRLVESLDMLARNDAVTRDLARAEVDLGDLIRRALALVAPELAPRSIIVRFDESPALPRLDADPDSIGQVVSNLVQNAARYTTDGGDISVRLESEGTTIRCAIANTGPEIPSAELPLIWERLHRVDRSRARATGGAGIGLAIVRQIIEAHGGEVGARS